MLIALIIIHTRVQSLLKCHTKYVRGVMLSKHVVIVATLAKRQTSTCLVQTSMLVPVESTVANWQRFL